MCPHFFCRYHIIPAAPCQVRKRTEIQSAPQLFGLRGAGRGVKRSAYAFALT